MSSNCWKNFFLNLFYFELIKTGFDVNENYLDLGVKF